MTRISKQIAQKIAIAVTDHAFKTRTKDAARQLSDAGLAAYRAHFGDKAIRRMNALPDGWLAKVNSLRFRVAGMSLEVPLLDGPVRLTWEAYNAYCIKVQHDGPEGITLARAAQDLESLKVQRQKAQADAEAAIRQFATIKTLIAGWPEIETFARPLEGAYPPLPAVIPSSLNKTLGLPVEAAAGAA